MFVNPKNIFLKFSKLKNFSCGFTLVELMVSVGITAVVAGVIIYNHQKFDNNIALGNVSYKIASSAREAQVYGLGTRQAITGPNLGNVSYNVSYGLHFGSDSPRDFILFADIDGNGKYRVNDLSPTTRYMDCVADSFGEQKECLEKVSIGSGISITGMKFLYGGTWFSEPATPIFLDIVFKRSSTDSVIRYFPAGVYGNQSTNPHSGPIEDCSNVNCDAVAVCLTSSQGEKKQIMILSTGQISVENVVPPGPC